MNKKKLLMFALPLFAISLVAAVYIVSSFVITSDVMEPFTVEYAIIGDAGNYVEGVSETCETYTGDWNDGINVDVGGLYAGESRLVCTRITNAGEGDVDYTFSGEVVSGLGNFVECEAAFGNPSVSGTVIGLTTITDGAVITVADGATPVNDCEVTLITSRG